MNPTPEEIELLNSLKGEFGFKKLASDIRFVLDIACFESNCDIDGEAKKRMYVVKELVLMLEQLPLLSICFGILSAC